MEPADVLPASRDLHVVEAGWPAGARRPAPLVALTGAGEALDTARREAGALGLPPPAWPAARQPVGLLYRAAGVRSILSWLIALIGRHHAAGATQAALAPLRRLFATIEDAARGETPLLRLYQYAADAPDDVVAIVSARKAFVFWDTDMGPGSREALSDINALWRIGEIVEPTHDTPAAALGVLAERARSFERRVRDEEPRGEPLRRQRAELDRLLSEEARSCPVPSVADVIPSQAAILWRPRRLELVDVERLRRWLRRFVDHPAARGALAEISEFVESARSEHADLIVDAFCTDSPEAL